MRSSAGHESLLEGENAGLSGLSYVTLAANALRKRAGRRAQWPPPTFCRPSSLRREGKHGTRA